MAPEDRRPERRLAAILAADVVGFSALMSHDEEGTHRHVKALEHDVIEPAVQHHHGRIVKTTGDGFLVEFSSPVEAVRCAVAIQKALQEGSLRLRIGINLGDLIIEENGDLYGDGVNVAARLEGIAEPGGICLSGAVYDQVRQALPFAFQELGPKQLKNINRSVPTFALRIDGGTANAPRTPTSMGQQGRARVNLRHSAAYIALGLVLGGVGGGVWWIADYQRVGPKVSDRTTLVESGKPSVAVLPFSNLSDDRAQEYFADGITDDVINDLSKVAGLFVVARNSTFTFKNTAVDVRKAAADLGVRYVVEGSVRRAAERIRINVRLVDAATGGQLWADRYEGAMGDVFALQDDIAGKITTTLAVRLTSSEQSQISAKRIENPAAYDEFLKGWNKYLEQNPTSAREAIRHFVRATEIEPNYPRAYAALAAVYWQIARRFWQEERFGLRSVHDARLKAEEYLRKAQQSPTSLSHQVATAIFSQEGRHEAAIREGERAIAVDPNDADAYVALAGALTLAGNPSKAFELVSHAMRLNPFSPPHYFYELGFALFGLDRIEQAATSLERAVALNPDDRWSLRVLLAAYGHLGRKAEAERVFSLAEKNRQGVDPLSVRATAFWYPFAEPGDWERMAAGLRLANVPD